MGGHGPACCAFTGKKMANGPAKKMSSLESHTMVPTLTMLGRFSECTRWLMEGAARLDEEVTPSIMTKGVCAGRAGGGGRRDAGLDPSPGVPVARRAGVQPGPVGVWLDTIVCRCRPGR